MLRLRVKNLLPILPLNKFNTFTPNHAHLCPNRERLLLPLQMQLFGMYIKFAMFSKKIEVHSLSISEFIDSRRHGYLNTLNVLFLLKCPISENQSGVNVLVNYQFYIKVK